MLNLLQRGQLHPTEDKQIKYIPEVNPKVIDVFSGQLVASSTKKWGGCPLRKGVVLLLPNVQIKCWDFCVQIGCWLVALLRGVYIQRLKIELGEVILEFHLLVQIPFSGEDQKWIWGHPHPFPLRLGGCFTIRFRSNPQGCDSVQHLPSVPRLLMVNPSMMRLNTFARLPFPRTMTTPVLLIASLVKMGFIGLDGVAIPLRLPRSAGGY